MDYKGLLKKYIAHVAFHEGITFLGDGYESEVLTGDEWAELQRLECEDESSIVTIHKDVCY